MYDFTFESFQNYVLSNKKKTEANSVDPDEAAHDDLPHLDTGCLHVSALQSTPDISKLILIPNC